MFRSMLVGAAIICLALSRTAPAAAADLKFQPVASDAGRFDVEMPGEPKETVEGAGTRDENHTFAVAMAGPKVFRVEYIDINGVDLEGKDPLKVLRLYRDGFRKDVKIEGEKEVTLGKDKVPGLEYACQPQDGVFVRERLFLAGKRIYTLHVVAIGDKDFLDSGDADHFFRSFKITK